MESKTFKRGGARRSWPQLAALALLLFSAFAQPVFAKNGAPGGPMPAASPAQEFSRNIAREFSTTADGTTALYNKYGKVNVKTWQNNTVKIDVSIVVNANNQRDADRIFSRINVNFSNAVGYVKAETVIADQNKGGSWDWNWSGGGCQEDFKINYEVWMPIGNQLDLKNKYGDAYVAALNGKLLAEIKYGNLRTETVSNDCELFLSYGKANINRANNLRGQISYGEVFLPDSRDIELDTKYSDLNFDRANNVRLESKYDDIALGTVAELRLQTKYSELKATSARAAYITAQYTDAEIASVSETLDADLTYGGMVVKNLNRGFQSATLNGKYADFELNAERGGAFRFELEGSYTDIDTPSGATIKRRDEQGSWTSVKGHVGDENAKGLVKAKLSYGELEMR